MLAGYEGEQAELKKRIGVLSEEAANERVKADDIENFLSLVDGCVGIEELTTEVAYRFIKKIELSETCEQRGKILRKVSNEVIIIYNCIGESHSPTE